MTTPQEVADQWRYCYAIAIRLTRDAVYAEEIAQDVMAKALASITQLTHDNLRRWLATIVYSIVIDGYRRRSRAGHVYRGDPSEAISQAATPPAQEGTVMLHEVEHAIAGMRPADAAVLRMAGLGYSHAEMAERMHASARSRLSRARAALCQAVALVLLCLLAGTAMATPERTCWPEAEITAALEAEHGEFPLLVFSNAATRRAMVMFATPDRTGWTAMIRVGPMLCTGFAGDTWDWQPAAATAEDDPS